MSTDQELPPVDGVQLQSQAYDLLTFHQDPEHPFTTELGVEICRFIQEGGSLKRYSAEHDFPLYVIQGWLHCKYRVPEEVIAFRLAFTAARQAKGDLVGEEVLDIADETPPETAKGDIDPAGVKDKELRINVRKELAAQLSPGVWAPVQKLAIRETATINVNQTNLLELTDEQLEQIISSFARRPDGLRSAGSGPSGGGRQGTPGAPPGPLLPG